MHRRGMVDADEHERRLETHRAEGTHRHPMIVPSLVARRDDRDAGREPAENGAEGVGVEQDRSKVEVEGRGQCAAAFGCRSMRSLGANPNPVTRASASHDLPWTSTYPQPCVQKPATGRPG